MTDHRHDDTASWDKEQVRRSEQARQSTSRPRKKKRRRSKIWWVLSPILYILFVGVTSTILASVGWMLMSDLCAFNKTYMETTVEVTAEDTVETVAQKLEDAGLIRYDWFFRIFGAVANADEKIGMGTHELNTDMDYRALIVGMRSSSGNLTAETVDVTIPEGYTVMQTIRLLAEKGVNTEEELLEAAQTHNFNYTFIDNSSEEINRLEGYLFPDTYEFYVGGDPAEALDKLISTFTVRLDEELLEQAEAKGYDLEDIVIIASLIEKETDGTDHGKIASVIYNRLENVGETAHLLQIDASLIYGLPEDRTGPLTSADLATDTPYNLYIHPNLPPTAIANPGLKSIQAALQPEDTNYYFYALGKDGLHHFSKTMAEHNNFVNSAEFGG